MKVLVACEYSGTVRDAFIKAGHDAISCDLLPSESNFGPHYQGDVFDILNYGFDMMIAHPPCTYLSLAGAQYIETKPGRKGQCIEAAEFFNKLLNANIPKIAVENPLHHGFARSLIRKYDQLFRVNEFGENAYKPTCLWLKNLPALKPTKKVEVETRKFPNGKVMSKWYYDCAGKAKNRSKTFQGIADAMANQWGYVEPQLIHTDL